jgi:hypothetical protein
MDRLMLILILAVISSFLMMRDLPLDDPILQMFGFPMVVFLVLGLVGYVVCRTKLSSKWCTEPILKIERDGITFRSEPLKFNLLRWEDLGEVSARRMSSPIQNKYLSVLAGGKIYSKICGEYLDMSPVNPNTLYKLAVDERTKNMLGKVSAMKNWMPRRHVQHLSPILIHESCLPSPLTPTDLVLLINTRKEIALNSKDEISRIESSAKERAQVDEKPSIIEIRQKIKLRKKVEPKGR